MAPLLSTRMTVGVRNEHRLGRPRCRRVSPASGLARSSGPHLRAARHDDTAFEITRSNAGQGRGNARAKHEARWRRSTSSCLRTRGPYGRTRPLRTVGDYMRFIRMWLNDGAGPQGRVLNPRPSEWPNRTSLATEGDTLPGVIRMLPNDAEFFPGLSKSWAFTFMVNDERRRRDGRRARWAGPDSRTYSTGSTVRTVLEGFGRRRSCLADLVSSAATWISRPRFTMAEPTKGRLEPSPQSAFDRALSAVRSEASRRIRLIVAVLHGWLQDHTFKLRFQHKLWDRSSASREGTCSGQTPRTLSRIQVSNVMC